MDAVTKAAAQRVRRPEVAPRRVADLRGADRFRAARQDAAVRRETGLVTGLMRMAPGAVLPDHEHVQIEQTYVLAGKLVDRKGRTPGSRLPRRICLAPRLAAATSRVAREGGLMLAIFQIRTSSTREDGASPTSAARTGICSGRTSRS